MNGPALNSPATVFRFKHLHDVIVIVHGQSPYETGVWSWTAARSMFVPSEGPDPPSGTVVRQTDRL